MTVSTIFPFAAMNYRGKFLAEGFSIFYLPTAALLEEVVTEKTHSGLRILAFGNPDLEDETLDLHYAVEELKRIRKQGDTILLNEQASETNAEEMMANYDILHFAVRGQFNPDDAAAFGPSADTGRRSGRHPERPRYLPASLSGKGRRPERLRHPAGERSGGEEFFRSAAGLSSRGKPLRRLDALACRRPGGGLSSGAFLSTVGKKKIPCRFAPDGAAPTAFAKAIPPMFGRPSY